MLLRCVIVWRFGITMSNRVSTFLAEKRSKRELCLFCYKEFASVCSAMSILRNALFIVMLNETKVIYK